MKAPPPQADPADLFPPGIENVETLGLMAAWYLWRELVAQPLTDAVATLRFFTDPDLL